MSFRTTAPRSIALAGVVLSLLAAGCGHEDTCSHGPSVPVTRAQEITAAQLSTRIFGSPRDVTNTYRPNGGHAGIDFRVISHPNARDVHSPIAGEIIQNRAWCGHVAIFDGRNTHVFLHMSSRTTKGIGARVSVGERLGWADQVTGSGCTATGPHLHYEIRTGRNASPAIPTADNRATTLDPLQYDYGSGGGTPPFPAPSLVSPAANATRSPGVVTFSWNAVSGATAYRIQIANSVASFPGNGDVNDSSSTCSNCINQTTASTSFTTSTSLNTGTYFWRVRAGADGRGGVWTTPRQLNISASCSNQCSQGTRRCDGNTPERCDLVGQCTQWVRLSACASGQTCSAGQCTTSCSNTCSSEGTRRCSGGSPQRCDRVGSCLQWTNLSPCSSGQTCSSGQCVGTGTHCTSCSGLGNCPSGWSCRNWTANPSISFCASPCNSDSQCPSNHRCNPDSGYCIPLVSRTCHQGHVWTRDGCGNLIQQVTTCASSETCRVSGDTARCEPNCTNLCSEGARQCSGGRPQRCERVGACTQWVNQSTCPSGQACTNGLCAPTCTNACTQGAQRCDGNLPQRCDLIGQCTQWTSLTPCTARQSCRLQSGSARCEDNCTDTCSYSGQRCNGNRVVACQADTLGCRAETTLESCEQGMVCDPSRVACVADGNTPGDRCANPIEIPPASGTLFGRTSHRTHTDAATLCAGNGGLDSVYRFVVTEPTRLRATAEGFDTVLALRRTCQGPDLTCDDDGGPGAGSALDLTLDPGAYFLWLDGYGSADHGDYTITLDFSPIAPPSTPTRREGESRCNADRVERCTEIQPGCWAFREASVCPVGAACEVTEWGARCAAAIPGCDPRCTTCRAAEEPDGCGGFCSRNCLGACVDGVLCVPSNDPPAEPVDVRNDPLGDDIQGRPELPGTPSDDPRNPTPRSQAQGCSTLSHAPGPWSGVALMLVALVTLRRRASGRA